MSQQVYTYLYGDGNYRVAAVGESRHEANIAQARERIGTRLSDLKAVGELVFEPDNAHDPNAVAVWVAGLRVGYFPRREAAGFRAKAALAFPGVSRFAIKVWLRGRTHVGAFVDLPATFTGDVSFRREAGDGDRSQAFSVKFPCSLAIWVEDASDWPLVRDLLSVAVNWEFHDPIKYGEGGLMLQWPGLSRTRLFFGAGERYAHIHVSLAGDDDQVGPPLPTPAQYEKLLLSNMCPWEIETAKQRKTVLAPNVFGGGMAFDIKPDGRIKIKG